MIRKVTTFISDTEFSFIDTDYTDELRLVMVGWGSSVLRYGWITVTDAAEILYGKGDTNG
jgi:hypothetical protein